VADAERWHDSLFRAHWSEVVTFLRLTCRLDRAVAEDLAQDTFLQAWLAQAVVSVHEAPRGWLIVTARNKAANHVRRHEASRTEPAGDRQDRDSADRVELEAMIDIRNALGRLPARQREVMVLRQVLELSVRETALALGIAEGTLTSIAADGRAALANLLADYRVDRGGERDG
jgi:RNA polymerase sigma factor (sigma-70 family)